MRRTYLIPIVIAVFVLADISGPACAQDKPLQHIREAVRAVERMLMAEDDRAVDEFIDRSMTGLKGRDIPAIRKKLVDMRRRAQNLRDEISVSPAPDGVMLTLAGDGGSIDINIVITSEGIEALRAAEPAAPIVITVKNVKEIFKDLESGGMAGVVYIRFRGEDLIKEGFGMANENLNLRNSCSTIFGIGSRPIDFTRAAVRLLEQREKLREGDPIEIYFDSVPSDKRGITVANLMSGESGLPDFFHNEKDRDPDLAWVDRETAVRRILDQDLLFEPGTNRRHSHAAFVLLAALIERVSGMEYYEFLRRNFFEPASMERTNEYGKRGGYALSDFAVGAGPQRVGLPNIPPNWGPASWLIKGSGGMYSTLEDLLKFYEYVRSDRIFEKRGREEFIRPSVTLDGSDRGFELFNIYRSEGDQVYLLLNSRGDTRKMRALFRALEEFVMEGEGRN